MLNRTAYAALRRESLVGQGAVGGRKAVTKVRLTSLTTVTKLREQGLKQVLVDMSWARLILSIAIYFAVIGMLVGGALYSQTPTDDVPTHVSPSLLYTFRGFSVLCLSPVDDSDLSAGTIAVTMCGMVLSTFVTLCLFDIFVEKFAVKSQTVKFADRVVLRRLPESEGGYPMLTFRYANLSSEMMCAPQARFMCMRRVAMPGGESLLLPRPGYFASGNTPSIPPAFFFHHVIDRDSPLYEAPSERNPTGCSFKDTVVFSLSVAGISLESQEHQAGWRSYNSKDVVADADFAHMLNYQEATRTGTASADFTSFNRVDHLVGLPEGARLRPHLVAIGLPEDTAADEACRSPGVRARAT